MAQDKETFRIYRSNQREIDKQLGIRYRSEESVHGETFTQFKERIIAEELEVLRQKANKVYPAWCKMPNETESEFRKRLVAKRPNEPKKYSAWEKLPGESEEEFKKRWTSRY